MQSNKKIQIFLGPSCIENDYLFEEGLTVSQWLTINYYFDNMFKLTEG